MTDELKLKLSLRFELLMTGAVAQGAPVPSQELHDILKEIYLKGAHDALELTQKRGNK